MSQTPQVKAIFIAPSAGEPMQSLPKGEIIATGIQGDRYANNTGAYSNTTPKKIRHLSLITEEAICMANEQLTSCNTPAYTAAQTRRNIVIAHIQGKYTPATLVKILKEKNIFISSGIYEASFKVSPRVFEKLGAVLGNFSKPKK